MDTIAELFAGIPGVEEISDNFAPLQQVQPFSINAHIHLPPNFSAFDTIEQAVGLASEQGLGILGASNYYDYSIYPTFSQLAQKAGILPLFGIEIIALLDDLVQAGVKLNDPGNPGKMYICGKGITRFHPLSEQASELLNTIRKQDSERMALMVDRLRTVFAAVGLETGLDAEAVQARIVARHGSPRETVYLQERHIAQAFQEVLFEQVTAGNRLEFLTNLYGATPRAGVEDSVGVQNEIRSQLMKSGKAAYVEETFVDFDHAYALILALGGIPCYPTIADGTSPICPFEAPVSELITKIKARNIHFAEFIPVRNNPEVLEEYVLAMREAGLVVTAGTEHNTLDKLPLAPTCRKGQPIPQSVNAIFWEGACVVVAHQYLKAKGHAGFVDESGTPNPTYPTAEERIVAFRRIGERVLEAYRDLNPMPIS